MVKHHPFGRTLVGVSLAAAVTVSGQAMAAFNFDVNGDTAAGGAAFMNLFDWAPDNILLDGIVPIPVSPGTVSFTFLAQGTLGSFGGTSSTLDPGAELTFTVEIPSIATIVASGGGFDLALHGTGGGGTMDIFYDDSAGLGTTGGSAANDITGTGYDDGRLIGSGSIAAQISADFGSLVISNGNNLGALDQFGADNQPGITTVAVSGNVTYDIEWAFMDETFFTDVTDPNNPDEMRDPLAADATFTTDTSTPFRNVNPSDLVVGVAPNYGDGINDLFCSDIGITTCDLQVEADARMPFNVDNRNASIPEPATLALMGLGLAGIGFARKRKQT